MDRRIGAPAGTELLRSVPMLALLTEPAIERLAAESEQVRVAAGEVVFHEGDPGDRFYVVEEGDVEIAGQTFGQGEAFLAYVLVVLTLVAVTLLAAYVPARRASHTDPLRALRQD